MLLLERAELTSGSTFHSAGLVGQLRADPALTRMNGWSADLYRRLEEAGGDGAPGWVESGSLRLASSPERLEEIRRQAAWAQRSGLPLELISAEEAAALFPLMSTDGVLGAAYTPTDGQVDPARLCYALAASARAGGARIAQRTRVTAITTDRGRVTGVRTDRGDVECEVVVDCGGMFAAEIAPARRRPGADRADVAPVRRHRGVPPRRDRPAAVAARSGPARLLPAGGRRPGDGRLRAAQRPVDRHRAVVRRRARRLQRQAAPARVGPVRRDRGERPGAGAGRWRTPASGRWSTGPRRSRRTTSSASARPRWAASSSPPASARTASPARAGSGG